MEKKFYVHDSSYVGDMAQVGKKTKIWHFSHIMSNAIIGENCNIGQNVVISSGVIIGSGVRIQNNVSLHTGVICEDDVFLGPSCVFTNVLYPRAFVAETAEYQKTLIKKGASIGSNSTIICGIVIGKYSLVGAGSVVTKDVPNHALVMGVPARLAGYVCICGKKLDKTLVCEICQKKYEMISGEIQEKAGD